MNYDVVQAGLFSETSLFARFLEISLKPSVAQSELKQALKNIIDLRCSLSSDHYLQLAFGAECWDVLNPEWRPADLKSFSELKGVDGLSMPSTQADILIWLHGVTAEEMLPVLVKVYEILEPVAEIRLDLMGMKNRESRDLIGFVDGTANPKEDKRIAAAVIPDGETGAGGSYVMSQRWRHDLKAFNALSVAHQEKVVGRTKEDDIELEGDDMPADSHVSRTDAKVDGVAMKIYRKSMPYAASQLSSDESGKPDHGLFFFAFACEMRRFEVQLERMLGIDNSEGITDKLMQYSTPLSGAYWFMPSEQDLQALIA